MPISGQTNLTTINIAKELEVGYQPLHLVEITFRDGGVLRLSSENLDSNNGGIPYNGNDYLGRLNRHDLEAISSVSNNGIVQSPSVTITISDAPHDILTNWENASARGFKGAKLKVFFTYWDPGTATFSSDSKVIFAGYCDPPSFDDSSLTVRAVNLLNMSRRYLPSAAVQSHCIWVFPTTKDQRADGAVNVDSAFFNCGYSPDITDTDIASGTSAARGNYESGTTPFTSCGKTWGDCIARLGNSALPSISKSTSQPVQIEQDMSGRRTGRFGGLHYNPPLAWQGRNYETGDKGQGSDNPNLAKFNDYYPMIWGKSFVNPIIMNVEGDPNYTTMECVLCLGQLSFDTSPAPIEAVIVNGYLVPNVTETTNQLFNWQWVAQGSRDGLTWKGAIFDGQGDPYGGRTTILVSVPVKVATSDSTPNVRVLTRGVRVKVWHSTTLTDYTLSDSDNPVWNLLDMLFRVGWKPENINLASFISVAGYCDEQISYQGLDGSTKSHARFRCGLSMRDRRTASEAITNFLASFRGTLRTSQTDGTLEVVIRTSMAVQQPSAIPGSNNQTAIGSDVGGVIINSGAYSAYDFDESNIILGSLKFSQRPVTDTPNRVSVNLQDEEQNYVSDSLSIVDADDVDRMHGQQVDSGITADGLVNYDQANRILTSMVSEQYGGNLAGDTRGTLTVQFETTSRCVHLRCEDLITLKHSAFNLPKQAFRIKSINPKANYETAVITANLHSDAWYQDSAGQVTVTYTPPPATVTTLRGPFGWCPNTETPSNADALHDVTDKTFQLSQGFMTANDGGQAATAIVAGKTPVNSLGTTGVALVGSVVGSTTSGTVPAGNYWAAVAPVDSDGLLGPLSAVQAVTLSAAGSITLNGIIWDALASGWRIYAGSDPGLLSLQSSGSGTPPTSLTLSNYKVLDQAPPDQIYSRLVTEIYTSRRSGVVQAAISAVTATTIQVAAAGWTTNQWAGYIVSILGKSQAGQTLPVANFNIASNTSDTLTLGPAHGNTPSLTTVGIAAGDIMVIRAKGSTASGTTIGDANFVNSLAYLYPPVNITSITAATPCSVKTAVPHGYSSGDQVTITQIGTSTITVVDAFNFTLNSTTPASVASYPGVGQARRAVFGLRTNDEVGKTVMIIAGTGAGQSRVISSNTSTTVTVSNPWSVVPDATSTWTIVDTAQLGSVSSAALANSDPSLSTTIVTPIGNVASQIVLVRVFTASVNGNESLDHSSPWREIFIQGPPASQQQLFLINGA